MKNHGDWGRARSPPCTWWLRRRVIGCSWCLFLISTWEYRSWEADSACLGHIFWPKGFSAIRIHILLVNWQVVSGSGNEWVAWRWVIVASFIKCLIFLWVLSSSYGIIVSPPYSYWRWRFCRANCTHASAASLSETFPARRPCWRYHYRSSRRCNTRSRLVYPSIFPVPLVIMRASQIIPSLPFRDAHVPFFESCDWDH